MGSAFANIQGDRQKRGVSVVLCCYNSSKRLPETLKHLASQVVEPELAWEIILVDNNSNDDTGHAAKHIWDRFAVNIHMSVVSQPVPGLSAAREKGFECAAYACVLFCDDDNWLDKTYVQKAYRIMESDSEIGILGGLGMPVFEKAAPEWFPLVAGQFATGPQSDGSGDVSNTRKFVYGAGMVIRHAAYKHIRECGFKSLLIDRKGNQLSSGGDSELCYAFILAGYKVWYSADLMFYHFMPASRLTLNYLLRLNVGFSYAEYILRSYKYVLVNRAKTKKWIWLRDVRHLFGYTLTFVGSCIKTKVATNEKQVRYIFLIAHIQLIKIYLQQRSVLDNNIDNLFAFKKHLRSAPPKQLSEK